MLCFLPPIPAVPQERPSRRPSRRPCDAGTAAAIIITVVGVVGLLTPVGWTRTQPVYALRAGIAAQLGPRAEDRGLAARLDRARPAGGTTHFAAGRDAYGAIPPGLSVDAATGALVGTPTMPGLYTVAISASDGTGNAITGATFKVKVLPAP